MKELIKMMDGLPRILKLILCLPALDVVWCVYRICRSLAKGNLLGIILGVLTIIPGATFVWIVDLICVILTGRIWWLD